MRRSTGRLLTIRQFGPTLNNLQQEQRGQSAFRVTEDQVFIVNFDSRGDHSVDDAEDWRLELHDAGFAGHAMLAWNFTLNHWLSTARGSRLWALVSRHSRPLPPSKLVSRAPKANPNETFLAKRSTRCASGLMHRRGSRKACGGPNPLRRNTDHRGRWPKP
jgi:hypothetical protein